MCFVIIDVSRGGSRVQMNITLNPKTKTGMRMMKEEQEQQEQRQVGAVDQDGENGRAKVIWPSQAPASTGWS
jgi:hypothetical protein